MTSNRRREKCLCRSGVTERASHFPLLVRKIVLIFTLAMFKHRVCSNFLMLAVIVRSLAIYVFEGSWILSAIAWWSSYCQQVVG
jgi:hypothetical protein